MTYEHATQFALIIEVTCSLPTEIAPAGRIIRPVFNKQWLRMTVTAAWPGSTQINVLLHPVWNSGGGWGVGGGGGGVPSQNHRCFQEQYVPCRAAWKASLPASRHITTGHWANWVEALPYVYPIIFLCHDHKAGLPRSVQFNFSMGPHWWKLCGLGFRSVMELRCAAWLVNHEGWIFLWMGGGRGAIYDWNPVIMAIWVDS